jgi:hypothetical protein
MNKKEFLKDPVKLFWGHDRSIPNDWIKDAWQINSFRENATYELVRSVRKNGDFFVAQYLLDILPQVLSEAQVVELYNAIRDQSHRYEDEWRGEFEAAFRSFADKLPPLSLEVSPRTEISEGKGDKGQEGD